MSDDHHRSCIFIYTYVIWTFQVAGVIKNVPANAEDIRDTSSIPGWGRSFGAGHNNTIYKYVI